MSEAKETGIDGMTSQKTETVTNIVVHYDDGSEKVIANGFAGSLQDEHMELQLANMNQKDFMNLMHGFFQISSQIVGREYLGDDDFDEE